MKRTILLFSFITLLFSTSQAQWNVERLPEPVNSEAMELAPAFSDDGNRLLFTSDRSGKVGLYSATRDGNGRWGNVRELHLETEASIVGCPSVATDGTIIFAANFPTSLGNTDIYEGKLVGENITGIHNLGSAVNSPYWETQPSITPDGTTLVFISDRTSNYTNPDIFISHRNSNGAWQPAQRLPEPANSDQAEASPQFSRDGKILYFASNREGGMGGFDIYSTQQRVTNEWDHPQLLAAPINSSSDDFFPSVGIQKGIMYFISNRSGSYDIYSAQEEHAKAYVEPVKNEDVNKKKIVIREKPLMPVTIFGSVSNVMTRQAVSAVIEVRGTTGQTLGTTGISAGHDTLYIIEKILADSLMFVVTAENFLPFTHTISSARADSQTHRLRFDIRLAPKTPERVDVYFDFNVRVLRTSEFAKLDRFARLVKANPFVKLEIIGHTDSVGSDEYNDKLSLERAVNVQKYFLARGIDSIQIVIVNGIGRKQPLASEMSEEERAKNRRVEVNIIKREDE